MKNILLIENDEAAGRILHELLRNSGYRVCLCSSGQNGLMHAKAALPDMIICGVTLADMDGYSLLAALNKNPATSAIPFIFLSDEKPELSEVRHAMLLGADDFLFKPLDPDDFVKTIHSRFSKYDSIIKKEDIKIRHRLQGAPNKKRLTEEDYILLKAGENPEIIKIKNIVYISAAQEYSSVYLIQKRVLMVQRQLKEWERILPEKSFFRIHRSSIVNLNYISKMEKWFNYSFRLYLKEIPQAFIISRRCSTRFRALLNR